MPFQTRHLRHIFIFLICVFTGACGSQGTKNPQQDAANNAAIALDNVDALLDEADSKPNDQRIFIYLNATQALLNAEEIDWARHTLSKIHATQVPDDQYLRYSVVAASLYIAQGQAPRAKTQLWHERLNRIAERSPKGELSKLLELRAQLLAGLGEIQASVAQRLQLHTLLEEGSAASDSNQDHLWQTLMELPLEDLSLESQIQEDRMARGWYTLAALSKNNQTNLAQQIREVDTWMLHWPEHPASLRLPADLQLLKQLERERPQKIALLLPFSGRFEAASAAIRDGIMAAYYNAATQSPQPEILILDSTTQEMLALYDEAVLQGAQLIIGPLEQEKIVDIAMRPELPVPVLALNRIPHEIPTPRGLFQFGLPLEDEAEQVASQAWQDGHRRAMVIAPANSNGDRSVQSFSEKWLALGGEMTQDYRYQDQSSYANLIKSAMKIDDSEERRQRVRTVIGKNVEFEPRRRQDVDFIFLYSQASQARQIKPLLAFHYAGDIPVYAIKDIYSGEADPRRDKDLNDIRFTTLPWFFNKKLPEKKAINSVAGGVNYQFLYALGVDAYHVHPRLRQLEQVAQANFYGSTGKLRLDDKQRLIREQVWAKFKNGRAVAVSSFTDNEGL